MWCLLWGFRIAKQHAGATFIYKDGFSLKKVLFLYLINITTKDIV